MTKPLHQEEQQQPEQPQEQPPDEQEEDAEHNTGCLAETTSWPETLSLFMTVCGDAVFNCSYASSQARHEVEKRSETIASTSDMLLWNHQSQTMEEEFYRRFLFDDATTILRCGE
eukprot:CAMPEP_0198293006 /NCGR_PEP_ID=MMETSP1449-20131203/14924_1 /TAXON_ID=420275 /ORGANISM="Attheya septentrionalis, Strain CCMP2084" /LENGTH=114 /DNA_ID=CAMNT_0043992401 /DNA_START=163 /DNA_END=507 /DNA_ORIENTATION=-